MAQHRAQAVAQAGRRDFALSRVNLCDMRGMPVWSHEEKGTEHAV